MLCVVLALTLTMVGAKELKFLTALEDKEVIGAATSKDPWSPLIGNTEGAPSVTPRLRSWSSPLRRGQTSASSSGRRSNKLVENLRRQLMRDNYDYLSKNSAEHSSSTASTTVSTTTSSPTTTTKSTTTKTTKVTTLNEIEAAGALGAKYVSSPYINPVLTTFEAGDFVARAHSQMQVASVNLQKFPMSAASVGTTASVAERSSKVLRSYLATQFPLAGRPPAVAHLPAAERQSAAVNLPAIDRRSTTIYPNAADHLPAASRQSATADLPSAIHPPAADHSPVAGYHANAYNPAAVHHPRAGHLPPVARASPLHSSDGGFHQFRSFNEAYKTPSSIHDQYGTEPKREVFKKDLLYYVDDDRLNDGLHLRRNNDLSSDVNQAQDREDHYEDSASLLSAQSGDDITTAFDTNQQMTHGQQLRRSNRRDVMYERLRGNIRHSYKKSKHREKQKPQPVDGIKKRARLYGLRPKQYGPRRYMKRYAHQKHSRNDKKRYDEDSRRHNTVASKRSHSNNTPLNGRNNNKAIYRRDNNFGAEYNDMQVHKIDRQNGTIDSKNTGTNDYHETSVQTDKNNDKKQINSSTEENNNLKEINDEPQETQNLNNQNINDTNDDEKDLSEVKRNLSEDKKDVNKGNGDTGLKIDDRHEVGQLKGEKDDQSNDVQQYSPYVEETTSNVKYKLLKVNSLGGSRRSKSGSSHHILQERGSQGVALISLDQAPFPQFQLPRARRQYMQETGNARHPLMEQLPKPTSRRSYGGHHHSSQ